MPNRRLTPPEIVRLNELQDLVVAALDVMAAGDPELLFALRRRLFTRLMHRERGTPAHRTKLKADKWNAQQGVCALCGKSMPQKGSELDRFIAWKGYTLENTRLVHHGCHVADQHAKGFSDRDAENVDRVGELIGIGDTVDETEDPNVSHEGGLPETRKPMRSQRETMRSLFIAHGGDRLAVCQAYALAETAGRVARKKDESGTTSEAYAKALWKDGISKGWLS